MRDDSGVVAVIVALMSLVLLGSAALAVDLGLRYTERRQMQNGADAAALATARDCAKTATCAVATEVALANSLRTANTTAATSNIVRVCGPTVTGATSCPGQQGPWDCPPLPAGILSTASYVRVETRAWAPPILAGVLGDGGRWVSACARASFGSPGSLTSGLPVTFSKCEFDKALPLATLPVPPYPGQSRVLFLHDPSPANSCKDSRSGADLPGGFGYLSGPNCTATSDVTGWFDDDTGNSPPSACSAANFAALVGTVIDIPIFNDLNGAPGSNGKYRMYGYAAFVLTGYQLGGQYKQKDASRGNTFPCSSPNDCISGFFVTDPKPTVGTIGGPSGTGVSVIQMSG
jgi:hypothetical protein